MHDRVTGRVFELLVAKQWYHDRDDRTDVIRHLSMSAARTHDRHIVPPPHRESAMEQDSSRLSNSPPQSWHSRKRLHVEAMGLRHLAKIGFSLQHRAHPLVTYPSRSAFIQVGQGSTQGTIKLDIWTPSGPSPGPRPGVLVCHGGGFTIGRGTDDSRWANRVVEKAGAVVVAINYRLAPEYPFPIPVEDCADAWTHILERSEEYGIDREKVALSGFSSGGNLVFASWILMRSRGSREDILGIIAFYPLLDYSISRERKCVESARPDLNLSTSLTRIFDSSYLPPDPNLADPLLSPAKADDETLQAMPPVHLCCCEYDMLFNEGRAFKDRLDAIRADQTSWRTVHGHKHAFDKPPPVNPPIRAVEEYDAAIETLHSWLRRGSADS